MGILFSKLAKRATETDLQGNPLLLVNGDESVEDMKNLIIQLSEKCPLDKNHVHCPFRILSGLTTVSIVRTVQGLSRHSCLRLFEMERKCRSTHANG